MTEANPERGEVPIVLGGKTYPMRPSYAAIQAIERQHGSILALATRLAHPLHRLPIDTMAFIVTECIRAAGKDRGDKMLLGVSQERISEMISEQGVVTVVDALDVFLVNMITGGGKGSKKEEEANSQESSAIGA